ncbi:MAG: glycosyltransferase [Rikenellaceae bacterium]|nr:glycosyltransferase [Rikenellaceae bacterium]
MRYSIVIPVYNRPDEVGELLDTLTRVEGGDFEVIIVEDGSSEPCDAVVSGFMERLNLRYFYKKNTGPGLTRNFGAERAGGQYVVFFDSDCLIPEGYFSRVGEELDRGPADAWGGPDRANGSFTAVQKAINYAMTAFLTTGGIRGGRKNTVRSLDRFYARSFNMGVSREVFESVGGFATMRVGEDIDLSARLFEQGYSCRLFPEAWVYHKRRTRLVKFFRQVFNFGRARVLLSRLHPGTLKAVHLLPSVFTAGLAGVICAAVLWTPWVLLLPGAYLLAVLVDSAVSNKSLTVGLLAVPAALVQLTGYGLGFISGLFTRSRVEVDPGE